MENIFPSLHRKHHGSDEEEYRLSQARRPGYPYGAGIEYTGQPAGFEHLGGPPKHGDLDAKTIAQLGYEGPVGEHVRHQVLYEGRYTSPPRSRHGHGSDYNEYDHRDRRDHHHERYEEGSGYEGQDPLYRATYAEGYNPPPSVYVENGYRDGHSSHTYTRSNEYNHREDPYAHRREGYSPRREGHSGYEDERMRRERDEGYGYRHEDHREGRRVDEYGYGHDDDHYGKHGKKKVPFFSSSLH